MAGFSLTVRVYWEDTDAGGIVYYANYLRFFERARTDWLRQCGLSQSEYQSKGLGVFVVHQAQLKYHSPARLDDLLQITVEVQAMNGASLDLRQQAWRIQDNSPSQCLVSADIKVAWVHPTTLKPAKIPLNLRQALLP